MPRTLAPGGIGSDKRRTEVGKVLVERTLNTAHCRHSKTRLCIVLPTAVWQDALTAAETLVEQKYPEPPPQEVVVLAEQRAAAREKKDWDAADRIRDELAVLGWQVNDTPNGAELTRIMHDS